MTFSIILHVPRRPDLDPEAFQHYWEKRHIPLLKSLVTHDFPLSHTRHYVERSPVLDPALDQPYPAIQQAPAAGHVDGVAVLTFANKAHYERFRAKIEKNEQTFEEDMKAFVDLRGVTKVYVVGADA